MNSSHQMTPDSARSSDPEPAGQFSLLRQQRFAPYFVTQLLGAFNDNVFKNALIAMVTVASVAAVAPDGSSDGAADDGAALVNIAAGLFILPFFLFSALGGQIADKYEMSGIIRRIKIVEIGIMLLAGVAFHLQSLPMLMGILFLMGTQSAFFGPIKYGILPQHLRQDELIGGNGMVEMGTFLAILAGTIAGTQVVAHGGEYAMTLASLAVVIVAVAGYISSRGIPAAPPSDPTLKLNFNTPAETLRLIRYTKKHRVIFQSILGISWFWLLGALYLAQFPFYATFVLGGSIDVFTLLLALFSIGIAIGSILCERLSDHKVEIGLVPFGAIGLTLFGLDLYFATPDAPFGSELGVMAFLASEGAVRITIDTVMIGLFGGFYIVPLYALIQQLSRADRLSRAIACNNILNALFMVLSAVLALLMIKLGFSIPQIFLAAAVMNAVVAAYIFTLVPEFLMRFITWLLIHTIYRVEKTGLEKIPDEGAVILACNHVSFVDPLIIGGCVRRPVRFVMYYKIYRIPLLHFVFKTARAIPIAGRKEDPEMFAQAFVQMEKAIEDGDVLCIFPEGQITATGEFNPFRPGIERLLEARPAPVIPVALQGLWGSMFSRKGGRAFFKLPRRLFARIGLVLGDPIPAEQAKVDLLEHKVLELRGSRL